MSMEDSNPLQEAIASAYARKLAYYLHYGKAYGKNGTMYDQIAGTVDCLKRFNAPVPVITAAWMHKSQEPSKLGPGREPLSDKEISYFFGHFVLKIVKDLASEPPEDKTLSKNEIWIQKAEWAEKLCPGAQFILLAEKESNFVNDLKSPGKEPAWHLGYYMTRMLMVEALKDVNKPLYTHLRETAKKGIRHFAEKCAEERGISFTRHNFFNITDVPPEAHKLSEKQDQLLLEIALSIPELPVKKSTHLIGGDFFSGLGNTGTTGGHPRA